jgi:hypothetical protein
MANHRQIYNLCSCPVAIQHAAIDEVLHVAAWMEKQGNDRDWDAYPLSEDESESSLPTESELSESVPSTQQTKSSGSGSSCHDSQFVQSAKQECRVRRCVYLEQKIEMKMEEESWRIVKGGRRIINGRNWR